MAEHTGLRRFWTMLNADASHPFGTTNIAGRNQGEFVMTPKTNTKIIRDHRGYRLRITPTRLVQIEHTSDRPWYTKAEDIRLAYRQLDGGGRAPIRLYEVGTSSNVVGNLVVGNFFNRIGCCWFNPPTFKEILRRFGVRKSQARAAKAGK